MKKFLKVLKWIFIVIATIIIILSVVRFIGQKINSRIPDGGINEAMYVDINGSKQWINIYGEDIDNPVLLYLHGGPGMATSFGDWVVLRKLAGDYTVVNWDQRNCGKSWLEDSQDTPLTAEIMRSDLLEITKYILEYTGKEKLTILGNSWGTLYGADMALEHPELVECFIGTSQVVDQIESDKAMKALFLEWSANDPEYYALAEKFDTSYNLSEENNEIFYSLVEKYGKEHIPEESYFDGDVNVIGAVFFNPYYSILDLIRTVGYFTAEDGMGVYWNYIDESCYLDFTLKDRTEYEMPVYILEGDKDYQAVHTVAKEYFDTISAPDKDFRYIDGGHLSTMIQSEKLAEFVHEIALKQSSE